jgi:hypothetical protein
MRRYRHPGRARLDDRCVLNGILFTLTTGVAWQYSRGARLRFRYDLLASPPRLATGRRLAAATRTAARQAPPGRTARPLAPGWYFSSLHALWRQENRAESGRSAQDRLQTSADHRRQRHPARLPAHRRQPPRRHPTAAARRGNPASAGKVRTTTPRPDTLLADRGYDSEPHRQALHARGIRPIIAQTQHEHGSRLSSIAGSSNAPSPGCISTDAYASATNATPISTKPS